MVQENNLTFGIQHSTLTLAPIVLFVYNRPDHTKQTVEALQKNEFAKESELFIYSDAAKNENAVKKVNEVREYLKTINGFKSINISYADKNIGCDNSVINGINKIFDKYEIVIVLEDDIVTSSKFLLFMNTCLEYYKNNNNIAGISGFLPKINIPDDYKYDVFFYGRCSSWGWATWKDRWLNIDWDVSNYNSFLKSSYLQKKFNNCGNDLTPMLKNAMEVEQVPNWDIRSCFDMFNKNMFYVYPTKSKVKNIGHDGSGLHCGVNNRNDVVLELDILPYRLKKDIEQNEKIENNFKRHFNYKSFKSYIASILKYFKIYEFIRERIR